MSNKIREKHLFLWFKIFVISIVWSLWTTCVPVAQCPFSKINDEVMIEWANEKPEYRFIKLAEVIRPWQQVNESNSEGDNDTGPFQWTKSALRLLHEAPEPLQVFSRYNDSIYLIAWDGSRSYALTRRLPLLENLTNNLNASIANAATTAIAALKTKIEHAREQEINHDRHRDERFEW
jgi:hypothetical protein